ncbi:transposase [Acinetobacter sp. B10A]|uniref:transposase n=1 Tax=Acinetobacter baretiae TaxID=2605383 RepID=UPI001B3C95E2|nr:transposase [Acinetobacter baretiae]MBF7685005.1 transposase [Acinetobacter baretiae]
MAKYSLETKRKAIDKYKKTDYKVAVCKEFNISRVTLDAWIKLEEQTGSLQSQSHKKRGAPSHIKDFDAFKTFINKQKFQNISDLVPLFEKKFGYKVSYAVLVKAIHQLGLRRRAGRFYG